MRRGPHTVTLYNALGEVDRVASFARTVLRGVWVEESSGAVASVAGSTASDDVTVFMPGGLAGYVAPEAYAGAAGTWTLREGDLIVRDECTMEVPAYTVTEIEATRETYRITGVETYRAPRGGVHHFEVAGR